MLAHAAVMLSARLIAAAPYTEANAKWNVNFERRHSPHEYQGRWDGHKYFPSPEDWRALSIYQLITDRFADGDPRNNELHSGGFDVRDMSFRHGGDFVGLKQRLPYIKGLGCQAIWISPVFQNGENSYHQYAQHDFTLLDQRLGTLEELRELTTAAHELGMYVLVDVVMNHMADEFFFEGREGSLAPFVIHEGEYRLGVRRPARELHQTPVGRQPYVDFWYNNTWDRNGTFGVVYGKWGEAVLDDGRGTFSSSDFHHNGDLLDYSNPWQIHMGKIYGIMDDLRLESQRVQDKYIAMTKALITSADVDGFRVDTPMQVPLPFFKRWAPAIREHARSLGKESFGIFGEFYVESERYATMTGRGRDNTMYGREVFIDGPATMKGGIVYPYYWYTFSALVFRMPEFADGFPLAYQAEGRMLDTFDPQTNRSEYAMWNFCSNHDNWRLQTMTGSAEMRMCLAVITFWPGVPLHYAGDEQQLNTPGSALDGWAREELTVSMAWRSLRTAPDGNPADGDNFDMTSESYRYVQRLNALRRAYFGTFGSERCDAVQAPQLGIPGALAFTRGCTEGGQVAVAVNFRADGESRVSFTTPWHEGTRLRDMLPEQNAMELVVGPGGNVSLTLPSLAAVVLAPTPARRLPPAVVQVVPAHGRVARWPRQLAQVNVTLRFDRSMMVSVADAVQLDGQSGGFRCSSASCSELVAVLDRSALVDGLHTVEVGEGVLAQDGSQTFAPFRSTFRVASQLSVLADPTMREQPGLICGNLTKLCHGAAGSEWLRIQNVGGNWSEWRAYEEVSEWQVQPGTAVLVQYHAEGSSSYIVGDCVRLDRVRCYVSWHPSMFLRSDLNAWGGFDDGRMTLVDHFTWASNVTMSEFVRAKFAPYASWSKAYGLKPERLLAFELPSYDPRHDNFRPEPFRDGTEATRKWMVAHGLWTEHESITSGSNSAAEFWMSHLCTVAPLPDVPDADREWHCHSFVGEQDLQWCRAAGVVDLVHYAVNDGSAAMQSCGDCSCCRRSAVLAGPETTCCVLFDDLSLNYSVTPDLSRCSKRPLRLAPAELLHGSLRFALSLCPLWVLLPVVVAIWGVLRKRYESVVCVVATPDQIGQRAAITGASPSARKVDETALEVQLFKPRTVLVASLEYIIEREGGPEKAIAGGLGKVAGLLCQYHPGALVCVHACMPGKDYSFAEPDGEVKACVSGRTVNCNVLKYTISQPQLEAPSSIKGPSSLTFYLVDHPLFQERETIYPAAQACRRTLEFYALWNQAVARLIDRVSPDIFHCPDFHAAMAVMYVERPLPAVVVLHNAEYQGAICTQHVGPKEVRWLSEIFALPEARIRRESILEGKFCMLKPIVNYVRRRQRGNGVCAVSRNYALEASQKHPVLWGLPHVRGIENCMPESERLAVASWSKETFLAKKAAAKASVQGQFGLEEDPNARMFVFVGRWVKQKGMDYIADIAEWMLGTYPTAQLVMIGPVGDAYGSYAKAKMEALTRSRRFASNLFVRAMFVEVPQELKLACDFCLMPSRDEPFGYVDIEFGWFGAAVVGSLRGGLGKMPGFYFQILNSDSATHMQRSLRKAVAAAMACDRETLAVMSARARNSAFPVEAWQQEFREVYAQVLQSFDWDAPAEAEDNPIAALEPDGQQDQNQQVIPRHSEFLRQEVSEEEMRSLVEAKLAKKHACSAAALIEEVEWERELSCETSSCSRLLGRRVAGAPILDWLVCLCYMSGPLLPALTVAGLGAQGSIVFNVVKPLTQAAALIAWTLASCKAPPHLLMAAALLARLVFPALRLASASPLVAAVAQGIVGPSDYLFLYYSFMGSSVGDISKLAIRTGLIMAAREQWEPLFMALAETSHVLRLSLIGKSVVLFSVLPAVALLWAPTLYRAFSVPELQFGWVGKLHFLLLLGLATVFEALSFTPSSAVLILRQTRPFYLLRQTEYCMLLGATTAAPMLFFALILRRFPSYAVVIVKAFACCSMPAVLLQCWAQAEIQQATTLSRRLDVLIFISAATGAVAVYAVAVAVLATVGSRWRFVSYTCMIGVFSSMGRAASFYIAIMSTGQRNPLQAAGLPETLAWQLFLIALPACASAVLFRSCAFFFFEREATGMLRTLGHKRLVRFVRRGARYAAFSDDADGRAARQRGGGVQPAGACACRGPCSCGQGSSQQGSPSPGLRRPTLLEGSGPHRAWLAEGGPRGSTTADGAHTKGPAKFAAEGKPQHGSERSSGLFRDPRKNSVQPF